MIRYTPRQRAVIHVLRQFNSLPLPALNYQAFGVRGLHTGRLLQVLTTLQRRGVVRTVPGGRWAIAKAMPARS